MTYYAFFDSEKQLVGASKNKIIQDASGSYDVVNTEIDEELYNDYMAEPLKYIAGEKEIEVEVPDYETVIEEYIDENGETQTREIQNQTGSHTETVVVPYPVLNPNYEQEKAAKERQRLDALTLTPADVERALYKAKDMDFEDLKALIATQAPQIDMKGLAIEFRANNFYRGVVVGGIRLIDTVGALLGYTPADMDYLFEHKELPTNES